jgi:hypothetical protein
VKRAARETKLKTLLRKLDLSSRVGALLLDIWREVDNAYAERDARQRAEIRRLRAFVRGCSTYDCACGDGDICVGCAARQVLKR